MLPSKKLLITGINGYIGISLKKFLAQWDDLLEAQTIDVRTDEWKTKSFAEFDVVFHAAGIVHTRAPKELYDDVNRDLTAAIAEKAKREGVKQFIFMSTEAVYGKRSVTGKENMITRETPLLPRSEYGKSKLMAEEALNELQDEAFKICILRSPMVYGRGCPGNYRLLKKLVLRTGIVPIVENERSMVHIQTLCDCIKLAVEKEMEGTYCPQDKEYVCTANMMRQIAILHGRPYKESKAMGQCFLLGARVLPVLGKAFGNLTLDRSLSDMGEEYAKNTFVELMEMTEP